LAAAAFFGWLRVLANVDGNGQPAQGHTDCDADEKQLNREERAGNREQTGPYLGMGRRARGLLRMTPAAMPAVTGLFPDPYSLHLERYIVRRRSSVCWAKSSWPPAAAAGRWSKLADELWGALPACCKPPPRHPPLGPESSESSLTMFRFGRASSWSPCLSQLRVFSRPSRTVCCPS